MIANANRQVFVTGITEAGHQVWGRSYTAMFVVLLKIPAL